MLKINLEYLFNNNQIKKQQLQTSIHSKNQSLSNSFSHSPQYQNLNSSIYASHYIYKYSQNQSSLPNRTISETSFKRIPGQRLYYQSLKNQQRKKKQIFITKQQKQKLIVNTTPTINPKSILILQNKQKLQPKNKSKKYLKQTIKPTIQTIQQQQLKNCTFKPQLISKAVNINKQKRIGSSVFQQLYNDHKIKQLKKQITIKQQKYLNSQKKVLNNKFENFIERNYQFLEKIKRKKLIIQNVKKYYDLQTGEKLFQPKIKNKIKIIPQQSLTKKLFFTDSIEQVSQQQNQQQSQFESNNSIFNKFNQLQLNQQWNEIIDLKKQLQKNALNNNKILQKCYQQPSIKNSIIQQQQLINDNAQILFS